MTQKDSNYLNWFDITLLLLLLIVLMVCFTCFYLKTDPISLAGEIRFNILESSENSEVIADIKETFVSLPRN